MWRRLACRELADQVLMKISSKARDAGTLDTNECIKSRRVARRSRGSDSLHWNVSLKGEVDEPHSSSILLFYDGN